MLTMMVQQMSKEFPSLMDTVVHERDKYMSSFLLRVASEHRSVVEVVGRGHLQGIKKHWNQPIKAFSNITSSRRQNLHLHDLMKSSYPCLNELRNLGKYLTRPER